MCNAIVYTSPTNDRPKCPSAAAFMQIIEREKGVDELSTHSYITVNASFNWLAENMAMQKNCTSYEARVTRIQ